MAQKERNVNRDYLRKKIEEYGGISEVARKTGLPRSLVCEHYSGKRNVSFDSLIAYCNNLNLSADMFLKLPTEETEERFIDRISDYTGLSTDVIQSMHEGKDTVKMRLFNELWKYSKLDDALKDIVREGNDARHTLEAAEKRQRWLNPVLSEAKDIDDVYNYLKKLDDKKIREAYWNDIYTVYQSTSGKILDGKKYADRNLKGLLYEATRLYDSFLRRALHIDEITGDYHKAYCITVKLDEAISSLTDETGFYDLPF